MAHEADRRTSFCIPVGAAAGQLDTGLQPSLSDDVAQDIRRKIDGQSRADRHGKMDRKEEKTGEQ